MNLKRIKKVEWWICIRSRKGTIIDNTKSPFTVINNSRRYWCADPFLFYYNGKNYLFFEMYDRLKRKGCLGYRIISDNGSIGKMHKMIEEDIHLSYPYVFQKNQDIYLMPESSKSSSQIIFKSNFFPHKWEKLDSLYNGKIVDCTPIIFNDKKYALGTIVQNLDNVSNLSVFSFDDKLKYLYTVKNDSSNSRNGGKIFEYNGNFVRVSQDCEKGYGSCLNFNIIKELLNDSYCEEVIKKISVSDLSINGIKNLDGIHTYNFNEFYEVIDVKKDHVFNLFEIIGFIYNKFKRKR